MFFTGFADEAAKGIDGQIAATKELGWHLIEARSVGEKNIHDIPEEMFETVCGKLADAGIQINCFGSAVANWGWLPLDDNGFEQTRQQLERALVRMRKLNCKMIRGMSFRLMEDRPAFDPESEEWIFSHLEKLVKMCEDAGVVYAHENCRNYGGMSYKHTLKMLDRIKSPAFTLIFDTGNPVFSFDRSHGDELKDYQSAWEFYRNVREFVSYVHIKDAVMRPNEKGEMAPVFTFPGEGDGDVVKIVTDLLKNGYDGGFSMEPHMVRVYHDPQPGDDSVNDNYVEYGRRFEKLVADVKKQLGK